MDESLTNTLRQDQLRNQGQNGGERNDAEMLRRQKPGENQERAKSKEFRANDLDQPPNNAELNLINLEHTLMLTPVEACLAWIDYQTPRPVKLVASL